MPRSKYKDYIPIDLIVMKGKQPNYKSKYPSINFN